MENFLIRIIILSISIFVVGKLTRLFYVEDFLTAIISAFILAIVNALIRPIIIFLTLPITIVTLGIFLFFINGACLMLASKLVKNFKTSGCLASSIASILISLISLILENLIVV